MTKRTSLPPLNVSRIVSLLAALALWPSARAASAEDWGAFALIPASAPALVLEAVGSGTNEGTVVSLGKPTGTAHQKWVITPAGNGQYTIKPSYSSTLVLAVSSGSTLTGTPVVLETDHAARRRSFSRRRSGCAFFQTVRAEKPASSPRWVAHWLVRNVAASDWTLGLIRVYLLGPGSSWP